MADQPASIPEAVDPVIDAAATWFARLRENPNDPELATSLKRWLAEDLSHARALDSVQRAWSVSADLAAAASVRADLRAARPSFRRTAAEERPGRRRALSLSLLAAALVIAAVGLNLIPDGPSGVSPIIYETPRFGRLEVQLTDGSRITLNGATRILVNIGARERSITVVGGEARFQVTKDQGRSFAVRTSRAVVRVTGTDFAVREQTSATRVVLSEGSVVLEDPVTGATEAALTPGQRAVYDDADHGAVRIGTADPSAELAWLDGQLVFKSTSLANALAEFERYTPDRVRLASPDLGRLKVSGVYRTTDLASFVDALTRVHPVRASRLANGEVLLELRKSTSPSPVRH